MFAKKNGSVALGNDSPVDLNKFTFTFHGPFILKGPEGITLEGTFNSGSMQGTVIYSCPLFENESFIANIEESLINSPEKGLKQIEKSKGVYVIQFPDDRMYQGSCLYVLPHGNGVMQYSDGGAYSGNFFLGLKHGKGELINKKIGY